MKRLKNIVLIYVLTVLFISCDKSEGVGSIEVKTLGVTEEIGYLIAVEGIVKSDKSSGFVYSTSSGPTVSGSQVLTASTSGDTIKADIPVDPNTTYYIRAFVWESNSKAVYGNEVSYTTGFAIGQAYHGGHIAYFFESDDPGYVSGEQHGLIISETLGTDVEWGCEGTSVTEATNFGIGYGKANTDAILADCAAPGIAARLCDEYESDGFSDWYLPSHDELRAIDANYERLSSVVTKAYCFSSTQSTANEAWAIYIWNPPVVEGPSAYSKSYGQKVMAVRNF